MRAIDAAIVSCSSCDLASRLPTLGFRESAHCRRCGAALSLRRSPGTAKTWALLLTAMMLYLPANLLPVVSVVSFGRVTAETIMGGVISLVATDNWSIAIIVFCASILVPAFKILVLLLLLLSVELGWQTRPALRTRLFWFVESIGRWSMIDVFVISILVALIDFQEVATVTPGFGMVCFAGVVVFTLLAALSFDPREIWDALEEEDG